MKYKQALRGLFTTGTSPGSPARKWQAAEQRKRSVANKGLNPESALD